jgi:hypothetical protein
MVKKSRGKSGRKNDRIIQSFIRHRSYNEVSRREIEIQIKNKNDLLQITYQSSNL